MGLVFFLNFLNHMGDMGNLVCRKYCHGVWESFARQASQFWELFVGALSYIFMQPG